MGERRVMPIYRHPDGSAFYIHFNGGFRAVQDTDDAWMIEPVLVDRKPCAQGALTLDELKGLTEKFGFAPLGFQSINWVDGDYVSRWSPYIPGEKNHMRGPAELWHSIGRNSAQLRIRDDTPLPKTLEALAAISDSLTREEALAQSISLSLRSMDINVEQIAEYYWEQVVNELASGEPQGTWKTTSLDETLYAHIHSFFLHLGTARDYLATLIAHRVGAPEKVDSLARLVDWLRASKMPSDPLLTLLLEAEVIRRKENNMNRFEVSGWFSEMGAVRDRVAHRRPYGLRHAERFGQVIPVDPQAGLYRYFRPFISDDIGKRDACDLVQYHYQKTARLFFDAARRSGGDSSMMTLTDEDISSFEVVRRE